MSRISPHVPVRALSAFLIVAAGASPASANVVEAVYGLGGAFIDYRIKFMPDLDQRRSTAPGIPGLPSNGAMYCVPTSAVNLFAYAANHGFPETLPGPGNWQSNALYNDATEAINWLGLIMGTVPTQGTDVFGWDVGMMVQTAASPLLMWKTKQLTSNASPSVEEMAALACSGWIVSFAWGRYDDIGIPGVPLLLRNGGHAVNLTRIKKEGQTRLIAYRDAADAPVGTTQSFFKNRETNFLNLNVTISTSATTSFTRVVTVVNHPADDGRFRVIDKYTAVRPIYGLTFLPSAPGIPGTFLKLNPLQFAGSMDASPQQFPIPPGVTVLGIDQHPSLSSTVLVSQVAGVGSLLQKLDLFTGELVALGQGAGSAPKLVAVGRLGDIYTSDGQHLRRLDEEGNLIAEIPSDLPPVSAIAYDDLHDAVTILSVPQRRLIRLSRDLQTQLSNSVIPQTYPMAGAGSVSVNPETGRMWFFTQAMNVAIGVVVNPDTGLLNIQTIQIPGVPTDISAGWHDRVRVVADGSVREFILIGGNWLPNASSPFHGLASGPKFFMARSSSNLDASAPQLPGQFNIHPDDLLTFGVEILDCDADYNGDDVVDGLDLGILLSNWGPVPVGSPFDLDGDGFVNGSDVGMLLLLWGPCP